MRSGASSHRALYWIGDGGLTAIAALGGSVRRVAPTPILVFVLFTGLELVTANLLEPWLYGTHTGISSLALLLTTVFWTTRWGPAGLILSTPLTVCVVVLGRHIPRLSFLRVLLGDEPVLAADAHLYQRLLAMDEQETRAVADAYLKENSLPQLYDAVFVPVLTLAELDRHKGALDPDREEFLFLSLREMLAEYSEKAASETAGEERAASQLFLGASCAFPPTMKPTRSRPGCCRNCWNRPAVPPSRFRWASRL